LVLRQSNTEIAERFDTSVPTITRRWQDVRYLVGVYTEFCATTNPQQTLNRVHRLFGNDGNVLLGVFRGFSRSQIQTATGIGVRKIPVIVKWHVDLNRGMGDAFGIFFATLDRVWQATRIFDPDRKPLTGKALCKM
jgi:hypothetical protein